MEHLDLIRQIILKIELAGYESIANEISEVEKAAATGGELISSVCSKLLEIKQIYPDLYIVIREDVKKLLDFAHSFGIYPE